MKHTLLLLLTISTFFTHGEMPLEEELFVKIKQLEAIEEQITAKTDFIEILHKKLAEIYKRLSYDEKIKKAILQQIDKLDTSISEAIYNSDNVNDIIETLQTPLCPHLITSNLSSNNGGIYHIRQLIIQIRITNFCRGILWQQYLNLVEEIFTIQYKLTNQSN